MDVLKELLSKLSPAKRKLLGLELVGMEGLKPAAPEPIAIIGMGCRFPGGANDPESYWRLLREAREAISEVPPSRWDLDAFYDADPDVPGKMYVRESGFLKGVELADFDAQFFGIAPPEAQSLDPQQRLLLEVAWEALEHAGQAPSALGGSRTGVFVGVSTNDYMMEHLKRTGAEGIDAYWFSGTGFCVAAGRISYVLGLQGPAMAVDTMCSSSLVSTQLACQHLREKRCDLALVGGVNVMVNPEFTVYCCKGRFVSADGRCKTFDIKADGYARGEGCGVIVLKRLSDAVAQGDNILAVVRGTAVNEDGRSSSLTAPNGLAQRAVIREALANADVSAEAVLYSEAHGTGTPLGDPIELQSLAAVLTQGGSRTSPLPVGAVKTNIGHLEAGAGMAGLIKVILQLQHNELVANLNLHETNPEIALDELGVAVPTERRPWPRAKKRFAGVSAFAFQGTNSHVVLEEAPVLADVVNPYERPVEVMTLSARNPQALRAIAKRYATALREGAELRVADICFTANTGRSHFANRAAIVARSKDELVEAVTHIARGETASGVNVATVESAPRVVLSFAEADASISIDAALVASSPVIRAALASCVEAAKAVVPGQELDLARLVSVTASERSTTSAATAVVAFSAQLALARLWTSLGVRPEVVTGHGIGEAVAAVMVQSLSVEDGMRVAVAIGTDARSSLTSSAQRINASAPRTLMVASATGAFFAGNSGPDAEYWSRTSPPASERSVLETTRHHGCNLVVSVAGVVKAIDVAVRDSDRARVDWPKVIEAMAQLYVAGAVLDWAALDAGFKRRKVRLPTYAFQRRRFWFENTSQEKAAADELSGLSNEQLASALELVQQLSESDLEALLQN